MNTNEIMTSYYSGYKWIKVPAYKRDETKSPEEQYEALEKHHVQEGKYQGTIAEKFLAKVNRWQWEPGETPSVTRKTV